MGVLGHVLSLRWLAGNLCSIRAGACAPDQAKYEGCQDLARQDPYHFCNAATCARLELSQRSKSLLLLPDCIYLACILRPACVSQLWVPAVVPDFDNWGHNFVLVQFDSSLASELEAGRAANSSEGERRRVRQHGPDMTVGF